MGSENRHIIRAAGLVSFFTLLSRIAGLARDAVVGFYFGTGAAADAFFVAFRMPNLLRRFVAEGAMNVAFIPVFTEYLTQRTQEESRVAASAVATIMTLVLVLLTALGIVFAPQLTHLFAPGFLEDPEKFALTVSLTRVVFPYIFLISLAALASGILNSLRHFAAPALSPVLFNLSLIGAAIVVTPYLETPVRGLAYGVVLGGALQLLVQLPPLWRRGFVLTPRWEPGHDAVRRTLVLMGPTLFGAAIYQINLLVSTLFASLLPSGSVSYLWYADRVFEFPLGLFAVALGTAALPSLSAQAARGEYDELKQSLAFAIRLASFISLPAAVGIFILAQPITSVLFERGEYGPHEIALTAHALAAFAVGLWSVSVVRLLIPAFYALKDARTPVMTAAVAFTVNAGMSLALMGPVPLLGQSALGDSIATMTQYVAIVDLKHVGLALATSIAATVNLLLLLFFLRRRLGALDIRALLPSIARSAAAAAAMIVPVSLVAHSIDWTATHGLLTRAGVLSGAIGAGALVFFTVAALLGSEEMRLATGIIRRRLGRTAAS